MTPKKILIAIPARYNSSRLPGKPLVKLNGKEMILRVYENAKKVVTKYPEGMVDIAVGTQDQRILDFCNEHNIVAFPISEACKNGTDGVKEVMISYGNRHDFVVNLQVDNPLAAPWHIKALIDIHLKDETIDVVTPCVLLSWEALDQLREHKKITPYSGTTAIIHPKTSNAIWFSKNIIPAIRKEDVLRQTNSMSPIYRHIGLYGYRREMLNNLSYLEQSEYESENLEDLEQLRFILNGYTVRIAKVAYNGYEEIASVGGVDSKEDIPRVEALLDKYGEYKY